MTKLKWDQIGGADFAPFFEQSGAPEPLRNSGRAFFGAASQHGQQTEGNVTGGSWLQGFAVPDSGDLITDWDYYEDVARVASVSTFGIAISGVSRTAGGGLEAIGVVGAVVNDNGIGRDAWGFYGDAVSAHANAGITNGIEVNATNLVGTSPLGGATPYRAYTDRMTGVANFAAGSDATVFGRSYAVDWMLNVANNGAAFWTGINFRFDAIMREGVADDTTAPGNTGYARAIGLAHDQGLSWYSRDSVSGAGTQAEVVRMYSTVDSAATRWEMVFSDTAWALNDRVAPSGAQFQVLYVPDATSNVRVGAAAVGSSPFIEAAGTAENINLYARGKGNGRFGFGTFIPTGDNAIVGHVEIVTADGVVRKLGVVA